MKIAICNCRGDCHLFIDSFNEEGKEFLKKLGIKFPEPGVMRREYLHNSLKNFEKELRTHPEIIRYIESHYGYSARYGCRHYIVEIPDDVKDWEIEKFSGSEWVTEPHKRWMNFTW